MRLDGRIIVFTGAGGLLGRALAERFAAEGAGGVVLSDSDTTALDATAAALDSTGTSVVAEPADVRDADAVDRLVDAAIRAHGRLDVMVNNAGVVSPNGRIHNLTEADWHTAIEVNLFGTVHGIKSAVRVMRPRRAGTIINTASVAGITAWPYAAPYSVSKAAVIQLTKVAALEYAGENIRVNCVCPGVFPSNMHKDLSEETMQNLAARHPLGLGSPADLVGAYVYLASDDAKRAGSVSGADRRVCQAGDGSWGRRGGGDRGVWPCRCWRPARCIWRVGRLGRLDGGGRAGAGRVRCSRGAAIPPRTRSGQRQGSWRGSLA